LPRISTSVVNVSVLVAGSVSGVGKPSGEGGAVSAVMVGTGASEDATDVGPVSGAAATKASGVVAGVGSASRREPTSRYLGAFSGIV